MVEKQENEARDDTRETPALEHVQKALRGLQFGEVTVIVQDGVIVQVERTERVRLKRPKSRG